MNRKKLGRFYCILGIVLIGAMLAVGFLLTNRQREEGVIQPVMSRPSGFYDDEFDLELKGRGTLYYTLDCSDPDENSIPYTGPIHIYDASRNENVYSMITDVSIGLKTEYVINAGRNTPFVYQVPQNPVDKAMVVRAVSVDSDGQKSEIATGVYFVGYGDKTGYDGMNIMTITTDPDNLFDFETGIYVLGKTFDDQVEDGVVKTGKSLLYWPANYRMRGMNWEKEAQVCCFDSDRRMTFEGNLGIRIQGASSRARLPKSLNLYARKIYGTASIDCSELLGFDGSLTKLNLNTGANGMDTMIHDYIVNKLCVDLDVATREYEPYVLFLDGEYWGIYWLTPRYKEDYMSCKYNVLGDDTVVIKNNSVDLGKEEDIDLYESMMAFICEHDMNAPEWYARACELIDVQSLIDYYAMEIYIANIEWPYNNSALWRTKDTAAGAYSDGRWRWAVFDVNAAMNPGNAYKDLIDRAILRSPLFGSLYNNEGFVRALNAKFAELARNQFHPDRINAFFDDYEAMMADAIEKKYLRFYNGEKTKEDFISACEGTRQFFLNRYDYITSTYGDYYEE